MTKMPNHIRDGYTESGYMAEMPGLHGSLRFKYRPMLAADRYIISSEMARKPVREAHGLMVATEKSRLVEWDSVDADGKQIAITADAIATLRPSLFDRLFEIISGRGPSDIDPAAAVAEKDESADLALEAAIQGRPVGTVREAADEKN